MVVGSHVDVSLVEKIQKGDYVDFGKLIPKDRVMAIEDSRMDVVIRNGRTFWVPVNDSTTINNFNKWEQAFRVYSNIYSKAHPQRASQLIDYNHVIHSISQTYIWDNVYLYDKEFRLHMACNPLRSWSIILQQAWSLRLKDRIPANVSQNTNSNNHRNGEVCRQFNKGKCNFGINCRYEHKCSYCYKFGHNVLNCRKASADRGKGFGQKVSQLGHAKHGSPKPKGEEHFSK